MTPLANGIGHIIGLFGVLGIALTMVALAVYEMAHQRGNGNG